MQVKIAVVAGMAAAIQQVAGLTIPKRDQHLDKKDTVVYKTVAGPIVYVDQYNNRIGAPAQPTPTPKPPVGNGPVENKAVDNNSPASTPSASSSSSGGILEASLRSKRGIAYNDVQQANAFGAASKGCSWAYNWGASSSGLDPSIDFIPTLGPQQSDIDNWNTQTQQAVNMKAKAIFSFNEPDQTGGGGNADLIHGVADAVQKHTQAMKPYVGKVPIGAPSVTNDMQDPNKGYGWLNQFVTQCNATPDCHFDFFNLHWYSDSQYSQTLFDEISKVYNDLGNKKKNIWITEFKNKDSGAADTSFLNSVLPQLDQMKEVAAYSYFKIENLIGNGVINPVGKIYAAAN